MRNRNDLWKIMAGWVFSSIFIGAGTNFLVGFGVFMAIGTILIAIVSAPEKG